MNERKCISCSTLVELNDNDTDDAICKLHMLAYFYKTGNLNKQERTEFETLRDQRTFFGRLKLKIKGLISKKELVK